uniref:Glycerophosphoryl diester phosphodiesterase family n=1 Tax=Megaviridae environmental sample TaxID=1737588 RepID=A0A5J6VLY3_9VIRU|nr:MAG: glycerophosphoryl diester phosphodiesterase family [Megaviridae environmental sample]
MKRYSHRGIYNNISIYENTIKSFEATLKSEFNGIEADVRLINDGNAIVYHDDTLNRLFNIDKVVDGISIIELKSISNEFLLLEDLLSFIKKYDLDCILDIKNEDYLVIETINTFCKILKVNRNKITLLSWKLRNNLYPFFKIYFATEKEHLTESEILNIKNYKFNGICMPFTNNNDNTIRKIYKKNLEINLYFKRYYLKSFEKSNIRKLVNKITY